MPQPNDRRDTRLATVRRRRLIAVFVAVVAVLGVTAVVVFALPTSQRVVVVKVVKKAPPAALGAAGDSSVSPRAPSDAQVATELKQAESASTGGTETETGSTAGVLDQSAQASFARLNSTLPERVEIAVLPLSGSRVQTLGGSTPAHGWSTTKVPVLAALLKARGSRGLTSSENASAHAAITASDNQSILNLFSDLEQIKGGLIGASTYVQSLFRLSGDPQTVVATASPPAGAVTTFGQTEWTPAASARFISALGRGCLLSASQTDYVLGLMQNIESSESWGLGSADFRSVAFKGGWGPEASGGYLVRQVGIVNVGSSRAVAVAIVAAPTGSFAEGTETLTRAASWLAGHLRPKSDANASC